MLHGCRHWAWSVQLCRVTSVTTRSLWWRRWSSEMDNSRSTQLWVQAGTPWARVQRMMERRPCHGSSTFGSVSYLEGSKRVEDAVSLFTSLNTILVSAQCTIRSRGMICSCGTHPRLFFWKFVRSVCIQNGPHVETGNHCCVAMRSVGKCCKAKLSDSNLKFCFPTLCMWTLKNYLSQHPKHYLLVD